MVNRIDGGLVNQANKLDVGRSNTTKQDTTVGKPAPASAEPKLSVDTQLLERTRNDVAQSTGVDRQKVDAIKTAIKNGEFEINAKQVANAFIDLEILTSS